jgi:hypothetical protein
MITYAILHLAVAVVGVLLSPVTALLPGPPDWLTSHTGAIAHVFGSAQHLGAWFPVGIVTTIVLFLAVIWATAFGIKVVRMCASFFTGGGGSAG